MPLLIRGEKALAARDRSAAILERVGLGERLHHKPGELSGGPKPRPAISDARMPVA
jgi:predicted ABC-type transport system involved in lysophospholipase L1 biosynthesis ATPase subunit